MPSFGNDDAISGFLALHTTTTVAGEIPSAKRKLPLKPAPNNPLATAQSREVLITCIPAGHPRYATHWISRLNRGGPERAPARGIFWVSASRGGCHHSTSRVHASTVSAGLDQKGASQSCRCSAANRRSPSSCLRRRRGSHSVVRDGGRCGMGGTEPRPSATWRAR